MANNLKILKEQKDIHKQLSEIYYTTKKYKKAYENYVLYKELNDSVFSAEKIKKIEPALNMSLIRFGFPWLLYHFLLLGVYGHANVQIGPNVHRVARFF